jgi:hypothetical protein
MDAPKPGKPCRFLPPVLQGTEKGVGMPHPPRRASDWLSPREVLARLGISHQTLCNWQQLVYTKHNVDFQPIELAIRLGSAPIPETPREVVVGIPADLAGNESVQPTSD